MGSVEGVGDVGREPVRASAELDRRSVPAAALAALAESAILFLPVKVVAAEAVGATGGLLPTYPVFVALFTIAVAAATVLRRVGGFTAGAVVGGIAVGVAQAGWWGSGGAAGTGVLVIVGLSVAFRVVTLALRDWRDPVQFSFGVGAVALLVEILIGSSSESGRAVPFFLVVPQFFLASLASRAASVRLSGGPASGAGTEPRRWARLALLPVAGLAAVMALGALLAREGGILDSLGSLLDRIVGPVAGFLVFLMVQAMRPILWLLERFGIEGENLSEALARLREGAGRAGRALPGEASEPGWFQRLVAFVILLGLAALLVRVIRRQRDRPPQEGEVEEPTEEIAPRPVAPAGTRARRPRGPRSELPEDAVRRLYAEVLLELERRGMPKPPSRTPAEFLEEVAAQFPAGAVPLEPLTRAYEDVRYGGRPVDRAELPPLRAHRDALHQALRREGPLGAES
jgi:hypothetical protein